MIGSLQQRVWTVSGVLLFCGSARGGSLHHCCVCILFWESEVEDDTDCIARLWVYAIERGRD